MAKLNKVAQSRLLLEAEEAQDRGLDKLSDAIIHLIKKAEKEESEDGEYSYDDMSTQVYQGLWELASCVAKYYDIENVSAEKLNLVIESIADEFISEVERELGVEDIIGPLEPKTPGEK